MPASIRECDTNDGGHVARRSPFLIDIVLLSERRSLGIRTKSVVRETIEEDHPLKPNTSLARLITMMSKDRPGSSTFPSFNIADRKLEFPEVIRGHRSLPQFGTPSRSRPLRHVLWPQLPGQSYLQRGDLLL
jgi:hypothetical protein